AAMCLFFAIALNAAISRAVPYALQDATIVLTQEPITPVPPPPDADPLKLKLGEELFRSRLLSRDQTRSCLSCHDVGSNGADGVQHAIGADGNPLGAGSGRAPAKMLVLPRNCGAGRWRPV